MLAVFYALVAIVILFVILHLFTELQKQDKIAIVSVVAVLVIAAIWYENNNNKQRQLTHKMLQKFIHGKTVTCGDINVTNRHFNYTSRSFVALENSPYKGLIIAEKQCK